MRTRRKTWGHNRGRFLILESRYLRELAAYHPTSVVSEDDLPLGGDLSEKKNNWFSLAFFFDSTLAQNKKNSQKKVRRGRDKKSNAHTGFSLPGFKSRETVSFEAKSRGGRANLA